MTQHDILESLSKDQEVLTQQYAVQSLSIFGSVAREDHKKTSDIDLLVSFYKTPGLFTFMRLKDHLEHLLGLSVDLVTPQALHPRLRDRILKELVHVL